MYHYKLNSKSLEVLLASVFWIICKTKGHIVDQPYVLCINMFVLPSINYYFFILLLVLYTNIVQKLRNTLHGPMHDKKVLHLYSMDTRVYSVVITHQSNPPNSEFSRLCNALSTVWSMLPCNSSIFYYYLHMLVSLWIHNMVFFILTSREIE